MSSVGQARRVGEVRLVGGAGRDLCHAGGVLTVVTADGTWVLPSTRLLWIPGGEEHETISTAARRCAASLSIRATARSTWRVRNPVAVGPPLAGLINHLAEPELDPDRRGRAEAVLLDLLEPVATATVDAPMPRDPRARRVAAALRDYPADLRLDAWGHAVGASSRTLKCSFRADTGLGFGRWRTLMRLQAALPELAAGVPATTVARHGGFQTSSAFVAAFRRETGLTPGAYFRSPG